MRIIFFCVFLGILIFMEKLGGCFCVFLMVFFCVFWEIFVGIEKICFVVLFFILKVGDIGV